MSRTRGVGALPGRSHRPIGGDPSIRLEEGARQILERDLSLAELAALNGYIDLLLAWQGAYRLVGSSDRGWVIDEVILDSLLFAGLLPSFARSALDLGSGAGIPGIPLRIVRPALKFTLLEPRRRRASFLTTAIRVLGLENTEVVSLRAEEAQTRRPDLRAGCDVVVSRCAGELRRVSRLAEPFLAPGGRLIMSGPPRPSPEGDHGRWVAVDHPGKGRPRTFFVLDSQEA